MLQFSRMFAGALLVKALLAVSPAWADGLSRVVKQDYDRHLAALFDHFHRNPELSLLEVNTSA